MYAIVDLVFASIVCVELEQGIVVVVVFTVLLRGREVGLVVGVATGVKAELVVVVWCFVGARGRRSDLIRGIVVVHVMVIVVVHEVVVLLLLLLLLQVMVMMAEVGLIVERDDHVVVVIAKVGLARLEGRRIGRGSGRRRGERGR